MDINKIDPRELAAFFNSEKAIYSNETGILTLSIFNEPDIFINISDMLISDIVEKYKSANFDKTNFFIKHIDKTKDDAVITPVQLYESLSAINEKIRYKHLKGLGSMEKEELYVTCADPETRYTYQINNMADIDNLFKYLGNDSKYRKELMTYQK
jgi:DNA gyrase/topoisomerase IV subunit B